MTICFTPNGQAECLFSEEIELSSLGHLDVSRNSLVEFGGSTQKWEVRTPQGELLFTHASRAVCLSWEKEHFEG